MGGIAISWEDETDPQSVDEYKRVILASGERLAQYITAELREITGLNDSAIAILRAEFDERARVGKPGLSELAEDDASLDPDVAGEDDAAELGIVLDDGEPLDLSPKATSAIAGLTPSERQVAIGRLEFLASLQPLLLDQTPHDGLAKLNSEIRDELKPALLIDGQHRIAGTKDITDVPFLVCALPHSPWPELAFQFIVTNRTARRVQESLLINIVGNSLSKPQRASIEGRLRDAGIRVGLIEAIMKVNEDQQSPFFGSLSFGIKGEQGFLDAAAMRNKVVLPWYERKPPIRQMFDHFTEGKLTRDRTDFWKSEDLWFEFFITFWSAVRERYVGSDVFSDELRADGKTPVSRLMSATVLKIFQETVLENLHQYLRDRLNKDGVSLSQTLKNGEALSQLVANSLKPLTPEFFQGWTITGFDGSRGAKEDLAEAIRLVLENRSTVAKLKNSKQPHRLFKEPA
jgi:hypothetical protein